MQARVVSGSSPTTYRNVMIFKFCDGTVKDRVANPNRWTDPASFSNLAGDQSVTDLAYTGLSQWLQNFVDDAIRAAKGGSSFYQPFADMVTDPDWNGLLVLDADLSAADLPPQIRGIAAGIDFTRFVAHHFGFTVSRVQVVGSGSGSTLSVDGPSSIFGLIDYQDPSYVGVLAQGLEPETPIKTAATGDFDFVVLQLQSRFENARLVQFQSRIQLTVNTLFGSPVTGTYTGGQRLPANGVVLDGAYVQQGSAPAYVFATSQSTLFALDSNVLQAVSFDRVQFNTLGSDGSGVNLLSRFLVWGKLDFVPLATSAGRVFDALSFGSDAGTPTPQLGAGLAFSNLVIQMSFPESSPAASTFRFDADNLAYDLATSYARKESLFAGFGLQLKSFVSASGEKTPASFGFLPVSSPLQLSPLDKSWLGVTYEVTLGGPGALASAVGFTSNLLLAWSPSSRAADAQRALFVGLSLPGAAPGASLLSVQGVFRLSVGSIALLRQPVPGNPGEEFYCLRLSDIALKIFGIAKLPPGATIQMFIFGQPGGTGSMGWYAAYVADPATTAEPQLIPVGSFLGGLE